MLSYIFSDPFMGLRFVPTIFKANKLDLCDEDVSLDGGTSELCACGHRRCVLRHVSHHRLFCAYGHRRCVGTPR
jgi:hypothetical protein